jgi:hypothetical protein
MTQGTWPMIKLDTSVPNVARMYNVLLGESDRQAVDRIIKIEPDSAGAARQNRAFLGRVVRAPCRGKGSPPVP